MGKFLESEKPKQSEFKHKLDYFSVDAFGDGYYKTKYRPFCLPQEHAEENLFLGIREPIMAYFARNEIKWHDGHGSKPSNHMCDSQVCCANFLFPFYNEPKALASVLRPYFPDLKEMLPIEDGQYIAFEWVGLNEYLGEISKNGKHTRGALFTSADAAVKFKHEDGRIQIVLIEWKYTESYYPTSVKFSAGGTDKTKIYAHIFNSSDCPLDKSQKFCYDDLFYEPFYQLMRQQFLAHEMEKAHELGADIVSLMHIAPRRNRDFTRVTSPDLHKLGNSPTEVWKKLVLPQDRFQSVFTEDLFGKFDAESFPDLKEWWGYIPSRYGWVTEPRENPI